MKVKYLNFDIVNQIKKNKDFYLSFFAKNDYYDKLEKEFLIGYYIESDFDIEKIEFFMPDIKDVKTTDLENSIRIYEKYKYLSESQASDERFWAGLSLEPDYLNYLWYRWGKTEKTIFYRMVYHASGKRGYSYHGIARPWWFAHLTYDESRVDPYELTKFTYEYPHIMEKMIYRNFSNSKKIRHATIEAVQLFINNDGVYNTSKIDKLYKYIGILGSNRLLDIYDKDYFKELLVKFLFSL